MNQISVFFHDQVIPVVCCLELDAELGQVVNGPCDVGAFLGFGRLVHFFE